MRREATIFPESEERGGISYKELLNQLKEKEIFHILLDIMLKTHITLNFDLMKKTRQRNPGGGRISLVQR